MLTLTSKCFKSTASCSVKLMVPALEALYENWPFWLSFVMPEMELMLRMEPTSGKPLSLAAQSRGRKAADVK